MPPLVISLLEQLWFDEFVFFHFLNFPLRCPQAVFFKLDLPHLPRLKSKLQVPLCRLQFCACTFPAFVIMSLLARAQICYPVSHIAICGSSGLGRGSQDLIFVSFDEDGTHAPVQYLIVLLCTPTLSVIFLPFFRRMAKRGPSTMQSLRPCGLDHWGFLDWDHVSGDFFGTNTYRHIRT